MSSENAPANDDLLPTLIMMKAAPKMLAALREAAECAQRAGWQFYPRMDKALKAMRAAIAEAEGRS